MPCSSYCLDTKELTNVTLYSIVVDTGSDEIDGGDADGFIKFRADDGIHRNALHIAIENGCPSDVITMLLNRYACSYNCINYHSKL